MTDDVRITHVETEVTGLKSDVSELKTDVVGMKSDVHHLRGDVTHMLRKQDQFLETITKCPDSNSKKEGGTNIGWWISAVVAVMMLIGGIGSIISMSYTGDLEEIRKDIEDAQEKQREDLVRKHQQELQATKEIGKMEAQLEYMHQQLQEQKVMK